MALLVVLVIVVFLVGLSMELKLGRLIRISLAIHDQLKELVQLHKANTVKSSTEPAATPALPMPPSQPAPRRRDAATEPEVYRID